MAISELQANVILEVISTHGFEMWYKGRFEQYLYDSDEAPTKEEVLALIKIMFAKVFTIQDR